MGIKGIYRELGQGQRVSLAKLAADSFVNANRPLRIAVDIAIWQFQTQAARGGTNPAIRTLFYRLNRFLGMPIEPIFVFDGPDKPKFKRNKRSGRGDTLATAQAKRLIQLFGFTIHDAPGEAEAECALLQQRGIVDVVLSEDVDTIMFGCTRVLRNWSAEGKGTSPTHVSLYDTEDMKIKELGLDREGMVLVALMSGGDYLPDGIPGCGVKVACEAAKANFGKQICGLKCSDEAGIQRWRESLVHELRTNENGTFRTKHKALTIPEDFPNLKVLRYYTHPTVSPRSTIENLREKFSQKRSLHLEALREFTRETFGWDFRIGAHKFIRVLSPSLLVDKLLYQGHEGDQIKRILSRRNHISTDATSELRLSYVPHEVVPIDLSKEVEEEISSSRDGLALNSDDEFDVAAPEEVSKPTGKIWDPSEPELVWVLEAVARHIAPSAVEKWEAVEAAKAAKATRKAPAKKKSAGPKSKVKGGMPVGAIDQYVSVTKHAHKPTATLEAQKKADGPTTPKKPAAKKSSTPRRLRIPSPLEPSKQSTPSTTSSPVSQRNPWTLSGSQTTPRIGRVAHGRQQQQQQQAILIESSPACPVDSPPTSPSPRPRVFDTTIADLPESVRSILSSGAAAEVSYGGVRAKGAKENREDATSNASRSEKLKQTSMSMFMTKSSESKASNSDEPGPAAQSGQSISPSQPAPSKSVPRPPSTQAKATSQLSDPFDDSDSDLEPLSILLSRSNSLSPSKRRKDIVGSIKRSDNASPSPPPPTRKKKLLVPRMSAVGFVKEVEVEDDESGDRIARESAALQRNGLYGGVALMSDVVYVDLTQDE
ncbi:hypothetical protein BGZ63DRAFT_516032 [Mariannaea sp. PMI_226]|nr:hypothetical protein BGZ63DRAFT_516032 [Mariannaea sp. PMI_226]